MDRTIKLLAASSVVMLTMTACAPGYSPYGSNSGSTYGDNNTYGGTGATKYPVTHSHGGKVHSHALPSTGLRHTHSTGGGYGGGSYGGGGSNYVPPRNPNPYQPQYNPGNNNGGVPHSHCGRVHSHPLPGQGLAHTHGNPACPAGAASGGSNNQYGNNQSGGQQQQQGGNNGYDYAYGNNNNNNANNSGNDYDYSGQSGNPNNNTNNDSYYSYGNSNSGSNNQNYYDSTQPKAPSNYYDNNSNNNYDYSAPNSGGSGSSGSYDAYSSGGSGSSSGGSFAPNNYSGGNSYTVKRGDTVFQVMRNTGVYWKDIIRLNNLQAPNYQINPGQTLRLK